MNSLDQILNVLSDNRRRHIIYLLEKRDDPVSIDELATRLVDHDDTLAPESSDHHTQLKIELYHNHLPKLADEDVITYDRDRGCLELANLPPDVNKLLAVTKDLDHPHGTPE